ncbi:MAG: Gfo/Idh/MocA family oxidoreductase, partial [Deltaproteobacteria bacterium]
GYFNRSRSAYRKIKQLIDANSFGSISRIRLNNYHAKNLKEGFEGWLWMTDMEQAGVGAFGDLGTHVLDILLWFMNDLEAVAATFSSPVGRYPNCDESGEALLKFKSGVVASIAAGWVDLAMPLTAEVSGTKAYAYVIKDDLYLVSDDIKDANANTPFKDVPESLPHAFDLFLDSVHSGESTNLVTPKEAAYRSTVMEAIYQAAETRQWVSVEPYL